MDKAQFDFNQKVKDKVTGFEGIVLGRTEYATGCVQFGVCPTKVKDDGSLPDWNWLDGSRLIAVPNDDGIAVGKESGGPHPIAPSMN